MRFSSGVLGLACWLACLFGSRAALAWSSDPATDDVVSSNYFVEINPTLTSDGAGGLIIAWIAQTNGDDIRAQRLDPSGARLWSTSGITVTGAPGKQSLPKAISDGAGGSIVVWDDERSGSHAVYAQRILANGNAAWATDGVLMSTEASVELALPAIVSDGSGGAIVAARRTSGTAKNVQLQRLDANGARQWGDTGVAASAGSDDSAPFLLADSSNGAFVAWNTGSATQAVVVQHVNSSGAKQWGTNGVAASTLVNYFPSVELVSDNANGVFATWSSNLTTSTMRARRIVAAGTAQGSAETPLATISSSDPSPHVSVADGSGGVVVAWQRATATSQELYMQHLDGTTSVTWGNDGKMIATGLAANQKPALARTTAGKFVASWITTGSSQIRAQSADASGAIGWTSAGIVISSDSAGGYGSLDSVAFAGGATVVAFDRAALGMDVYAKLLNADGTLGSAETDGGVDGGGGSAGAVSDGGSDASTGGTGGISPSGGSGGTTGSGAFPGLGATTGKGGTTNFGGGNSFGATSGGGTGGKGGAKASGESDDGGCGCRSAGTASTNGFALGALVALALYRLNPLRRRSGSSKAARSKSRARTP